MAKKKEKYRLEALLKVKYKNKREAEIELGKAFKNLKEEEQRLKDLEEEKKKIIETRESSRREMALKLASGESQISESHGHLNYIQRLQEEEEKKDQEIEEQKEEVKRAEERVTQARRDYINACKEVKMMEKHKELWKKKMLKELEKEETKQMNELGNVLHQMKSVRKEQGEWQ